MRKMESYTYKKWNKMWRLWKLHYLIHAYEILNEVEKDAWEYINTGKY